MQSRPITPKWYLLVSYQSYREPATHRQVARLIDCRGRVSLARSRRPLNESVDLPLKHDLAIHHGQNRFGVEDIGGLDGHKVAGKHADARGHTRG